MTVSCIVIMVYLVLFIVNQQYMLKVIQKYQIRFLNHQGDMMSLLVTLVALGFFLFAMYGWNADQIGVPIADFPPIVPKDQEVYSYYGLPNPKLKKEPQLLEL